MKFSLVLLAAAAPLVDSVHIPLPNGYYGFNGESAWFPFISNVAGGLKPSSREQFADPQFPKRQLSGGRGPGRNIVVDASGDIYQSTEGHQILKYSGGSYSIFAGIADGLNTDKNGTPRQCTEGLFTSANLPITFTSQLPVDQRYVHGTSWIGKSPGQSKLCHRLASYFKRPRGMVFHGNFLYVAQHAAIRQINMLTNEVSLLAGDSEGVPLAAADLLSTLGTAKLNSVQDLAIDSNGVIYFLDVDFTGNTGCIRKIAGDTITTVINRGASVSHKAHSIALFNIIASPSTNVFPSGNVPLFFTDKDHTDDVGAVIKYFDGLPNSSAINIVGDFTDKTGQDKPSRGLGTTAKLTDVYGLSIDRKNRMWFSNGDLSPAETLTSELNFVDLNKNYDQQSGKPVVGASSFMVHQAVPRVVKHTLESGPVGDGPVGSGLQGSLSHVDDLAFDRDGNIVLLERHCYNSGGEVCDGFIRTLTGTGIQEAGGTCHNSVCSV